MPVFIHGQVATSDDKLLALVDPHLLPRPGTLARFVDTAQLLSHNSFQTLCPYGTDDLGEGSA